MLNSSQSKNLLHIYRFFMESEANGWNAIDDHLEMLEWLDDSELYREADVLYSHHKNKNMGCNYTHKEGSYCPVKSILEAVESVLELHKDSENLHPKNRYVLAYYLALSQDAQIVENAH